jgi:O-antigen/teichoic acid export membrane protein
VSVSWTLAGYAAYMACQWGMLVVVARLGSPAQVGELAIGLAVSAPVVLFTNLGLRRLQVTDASGSFLFADYFGLRLFMSGVALAVIEALAAVSGYGFSVVGVILAMGLAKTVEAASDVVGGVLQRAERMDLVAGSLALRGISGLTGLAAGMAATGRVAVGVLCLALGWAAVLVFNDLPRASRILAADKAAGGLRPRWSRPTMARLAWLALPLGLVTALMSLMASIPTLFIEKFRGAAELGVYSALAYAYAASHRIASAMGEAASARLARHHAEGDRRAFLRVLGRLLVLAGSGAAAGVALAYVAGRQILTVVYGPVYGERADLLVALLLVCLVSDLGIILDYTITAMRRIRIQPVVYAATVLVYAALCARLIPSRGLAGAVLALGIVSVFQGVVTLGVLARALAAFPPARDAAPAKAVAS